MMPGIKMATIETTPINSGWYIHSRLKQIKAERLIKIPEMIISLLFIEIPEIIVPIDNKIRITGIRFSFRAGANRNPKIIILTEIAIQLKETILLI